MTVHIRAFHCRPICERLPCVMRRSITAVRMLRSAASLRRNSGEYYARVIFLLVSFCGR